jgi:hypothetical protein
MRPTYMQQHAASPRTVRPRPATGASRSLALDIYRGVVWGDFDHELGVGGAIAQSTVGFIPGVGTVAALRDLIACMRQHDLLGVLLNLLAAFPVFGGLAKIADAVHTVHRYQRARQLRKQRRLDGSVGHYQTPLSTPRRSGWASFGGSLLVAGFVGLYGLAVRLLFEYLWAHGPTIQGYAFHDNGAWLAPLILLPLGLIIGLTVTVSNRLWLGLMALPIVLALGFFLTQPW